MYGATWRRVDDMIILNAEFPAGMAIEDAIKDALKFSRKNNCMLRCDINDVKLTIVADIVPVVDKVPDKDAVEYYKRIYLNELQKGNPKNED